MRFSYPLVLLLLLLILLAARVGWPARGYGRRRELTSLVLRSLILLSLILALSGLTHVQLNDRMAVVFLLDVSDSMPEAAQQAAMDYIGQALAAMPPDDQAALIVFGGDALIEHSMSQAHQLGPILSIPDTSHTDLEQAIRLGLAVFPPDAARRLVLLTDGTATTGDTAAAVALATASGVDLIGVPFGTPPPAEVLLSQATLPAHLSQGEQFYLEVTLQAATPTPTLVRVTQEDRVVHESLVELRRGEQTLSLPITASEPGFTSYLVQIFPQQDTYYQNNSLSAFTQIAGPPRVLVVSPPAGEPLNLSGDLRPDEYSRLVQALGAAGYQVSQVSPSGLTSELTELIGYASVVLVDVPARQLNQAQMDTLGTYVQEMGGGLVTVGGPTSYGMGGYFRTPLEELLPVDVQIHDQLRRPVLSMVFIIDHSGSMGETGGGINKLQLALEAAIRSVELMFPTDRVGVVAFDDTASWVVEMTDLNDPQAVIDAIGSIRVGGGTNILAGLQAMARILPDDPGTIKHVILLTDGGADPSGIPELVTRLYADHGITLTTVGVGQDAAPYLAELAALGGGRYHFTADPRTIPAILTEETSLASRAYLVEEPTAPMLASPSPILAGIEALPSLSGYVATSLRQTAQTILVSHLGDPLLASWQYGLGRVVSFTSDASSHWAADWVAWDGFPVFWAQVVEASIGNQVLSPLDIQVDQSGEIATLTVDAMQTEASPAGALTHYYNNYQMEVSLVSPDGESAALSLAQTAPGRYQASFHPTQQGTYLLQVTGTPLHPAEPPLSGIAGWVMDYSPEYRSPGSDPAVLIQLIQAAGGRVASQAPADIFTHDLTSPPSPQSIWTWLILAAAILLPFDIAVRRLALGKHDLIILWKKLGKFIITLRQRRTSATLPAPSPIRSLFKVKTPQRPVEQEKGSPEIQSWVQSLPPASDVTTISPGPQAKPEAPPPPAPPSTADETSQTTAAHLLARKRRQRDQD